MRDMFDYVYYAILAIGIPGLFIGPILYLLRWDIATPFERLINMSCIFLLALLVLGVLYAGSRIGLRMEPDIQARQARLEKLNQGYQKLLLVYVPIMLLIIAAHIWLLMRG